MRTKHGYAEILAAIDGHRESLVCHPSTAHLADLEQNWNRAWAKYGKLKALGLLRKAKDTIRKAMCGEA